MREMVYFVTTFMGIVLVCLGIAYGITKVFYPDAYPAITQLSSPLDWGPGLSVALGPVWCERYWVDGGPLPDVPSEHQARMRHAYAWCAANYFGAARYKE